MVEITTDDPRPPYVQIADDIRAQIDAGALKAGEKLPSGRELSTRYGVASMTVQRAMQLLRSEGRVVSWQGRGNFIADAGPEDSTDTAARIAWLEQAVRGLTERVDSLDARLGKADRG
ncbi:GntR family transcriptional regulator [Phytoactinopolyspora halotolerans]|uniref:GntR family transcriptional regulator n=1 Tax=Phytoactinopolyspora halotolerans TaxID=1981512 RepID=A0A6L9S9Z8_9ACTN|nr:GntR family transcriptional regulator [Phytoactinopolyspora halotolerans]NEE02066.1 GntR family transcriptional regulator [Phytoactinopolyspora halotolerans]